MRGSLLSDVALAERDAATAFVAGLMADGSDMTMADAQPGQPSVSQPDQPSAAPGSSALQELTPLPASLVISTHVVEQPEPAARQITEVAAEAGEADAEAAPPAQPSISGAAEAGSAQPDVEMLQPDTAASEPTPASQTDFQLTSGAYTQREEVLLRQEGEGEISFTSPSTTSRPCASSRVTTPPR